MSRGKTEGRERVGNDRGERYIYIYMEERKERRERYKERQRDKKRQRKDTGERRERKEREQRQKTGDRERRDREERQIKKEKRLSREKRREKREKNSNNTKNNVHGLHEEVNCFKDFLFHYFLFISFFYNSLLPIELFKVGKNLWVGLKVN